MLTLTRKVSEEIILRTEQGVIRVVVSQIKGKQTRISIEAPKEIKILRKEVADEEKA